MADLPTILIVDDNLSSLRNRAEMFSESGITVREATSVEEALAVVSREPQTLDLAILDINLTGDPLDKSGIALAERLRAQLPDVPLVAYTGYYSEDELTPHLRAVFTHWVVKGSLDLSSLDEFVDRCATLARRHRERSQ
ncbi:MAG: response regulator [Solirubrobacteraceae bacterium]